MQIQLTKKQDLQTNTWSGGTSTQLAIYPKEAVYKNLDFMFRISTATIDTEESTFTSLPGVSRHIMILKGELTLQHTDQYTKQLKKFDTDSFTGNWETTSIGKVTDFNVMTRGHVKSTLSGFSLQAKTSKEIVLEADVLAIYVPSGEIDIDEIILQQGDLALISREHPGEKMIVKTITAADIVITQIYF